METKETKDGIVYICEKCEKEVGQVIFNRETKKWECAKCFYKKREG